MKHELRSPVRCRRPDGDGRIVNPALGKSLPKHILEKFYQYGAVKHGDISKHDSQPLFTHRPSDGTLVYNSTEISANNWGGVRQREKDGWLSATTEECAGSIRKPSTSGEETSKSQGVNVLNVLPNCQSAHERDAGQAIALLKYNISANNMVQPPYDRFCHMSASDTAITFPKRQCMAWCPYTRLDMSSIAKKEDFSTVINMQAQRNNSYQSSQKCPIPHSDLGSDEFIIGSVNNVCSVQCLDTSPLKLPENAFSCNLPVVTGTTASTSSGSHSSDSATTHSAKSPPVLHVGDMVSRQDNNSSLAHTISPSTFSAKATQDRPPSPSSNTILQASSRSFENSLQHASLHSNSQVPDPTPISWNPLDVPRAEAMPECSLAKDGGYFDKMVDLILSVLFAMFIKESNNRHIKTPTADNPGMETLKSNYKRTPKEKVCSSLLVERWNPEQCIKDTKPLLQVKYNAPVRSSTRPTSRNNKAEKRAKSEPPAKRKKSVSHKPLNYVKKKVFVQLSGDSISPKKAEKRKERPVVSSTSPRKLSSMAHGYTKLSNTIKTIPHRQNHFLKAKEVTGNIETSVSEKSKAQNAPVVKDNNATVKKIKYISPKWCAKNDIRAVGRGLLHDNAEANVHNTVYIPENTLISNRTKGNRCWTCLTDQAPKSPPRVHGLTKCNHSTNGRKPQASMLYHDIVDCQDCNNEQLTTRQQVFPKKSYGMENLLVDNQITSGGKRYTVKLPSQKTYVDERAGSMSVKKKPTVNIGIGECLGAKDDLDLMEPNKISRHQKSHYDFENNKVTEQMLGRINHPTSPDNKSNALNAKRGYHRARKESNICFNDDLKFCLPSWPIEGGFHIESSRHRNEPENNYYNCKQCISGESDEQDESGKHMKYTGSTLRYDCADSGDSQFSKHIDVIDLSVDNSIFNLPKHRTVFSNGPEYCKIEHVCNTDKAESHIRTGQLSHTSYTEPILTEKSDVEESNVKIDTRKENVQRGENIYYFSLPVNPQAINNTTKGKYQQLPAPKENVLSTSKYQQLPAPKENVLSTSKYQQLPAPKENILSTNKCHDEPEPELVKWLEEDSSSDRILQELCGISPSDQKSQLREIAKGNDMSHELDEAQDSRRANRDGFIQRIINDFEFQNYLGEMKCQCSQSNGTPKRRNLSRWHVLGHADKDLKMSHRAMGSSRTLNDDTGRLEVSPNYAQRGLYDNTFQQTLIKDCNLSPRGHQIPGYLSEIEETLFQGGEPTLAEKHFRYPPAGDAVLPGNAPQSADSYIQSALQQICAENININKSGISSSERPLNTDNLHKVQSRANYHHLEENAYLSWGFDQADVLRNGSRFTRVQSDFDQSENVEMDNLIMSKDTNVSKHNSDSKYPLEVCPTLFKSVKDAGISEVRGTSHKGHPDGGLIAWKFNRDSQRNFANPTIPGNNQNYSGHPYTFTERGPWALRWNRWQVSHVQEEPLDLSRKKKQTSSPLINHPDGSCDNCLQDLVPIVTEHTWFQLQSSPLDLSTKRPC